MVLLTAVLVPDNVSCAGLKLHVKPAAMFGQESVIGPVNPPVAVRATLKFDEVPTLIVAEVPGVIVAVTVATVNVEHNPVSHPLPRLPRVRRARTSDKRTSHGPSALAITSSMRSME